MPILLSANNVSTKLMYPTDNNSTEMHSHFAEAVTAKAKLRDPLAFTLGEESRLTSEIQHQQALTWLLKCAPINYNTRPKSLRHYDSDGLQIRGWLMNINYLAGQLIRENYQQGWHRAHPAFWLEFGPVDLTGGTYHHAAIDQRHWPLFVQSVMMSHWLDTGSVRASLQAEDQCKVTFDGMLTTLISCYPKLEKLDSDGALVPSDVEKSPMIRWLQNMHTAARHYGDWLARQQRRAG